jgi:hypothetical protein
MRQITKESVNAFYKGINFKKANMEVSVGNDWNGDSMVFMYLHGNQIAEKYLFETNRIWINACGWFSKTTKERLNNLRGVSIYQKDFVWYLNGKEWDGKRILVEIK